METSAFSRILLSSIYSSEGWDFPDSLLRKFYFTRISHYIPYLCHGQNGDDYPRENHQIISNPTIPSPSFLQHPKNHGFKAPFSSYGIGFAHKMWPLFLSLYVFKRTPKNANRAPGFKRLTPGLAPPSFCAAHHRCATHRGSPLAVWWAPSPLGAARETPAEDRMRRSSICFKNMKDRTR